MKTQKIINVLAAITAMLLAISPETLHAFGLSGTTEARIMGAIGLTVAIINSVSSKLPNPRLNVMALIASAVVCVTPDALQRFELSTNVQTQIMAISGLVLAATNIISVFLYSSPEIGDSDSISSQQK